MYPETFFHTIRQKLKKEWLFAFFTAFFCGLFIHFYRLTNHLLTWDSVYNFHSNQNTIHIGRCFLTLGCGISSYYDLQWIIGLLSLIYISLSCVCLTEIFSLQKKTSIFLISALTVAFPSVAGTFAYMYTADGYFLAMLAAVLAVLITLKYKRGFWVGIVLLAFSYGSYQAYVSYAVLLILSWSIMQLLEERLGMRQLLSYWLRFLIMGGLGTILYLLCNKLLTVIEGVSTSDYNGISSMGLPDGPGLILATKNCIIDFVYFFFGPLNRMNFYKMLNVCILFLLAILIFQVIFRKRLYKNVGNFVMLLFCFTAIPFACSMIYFLSSTVRYYMLMYACFSLIYILPVLIYDNMTPMSYKSPFWAWCCILVTGLNIFNFALIDNISYLYMTTSNHMTYELTARMTDRIEQLDDFENAEKLCIIGHFDDYDTISLNLPPAMAGVRDSYLISEQEHFVAMMDIYFGLSLKNCSEEERLEIQRSDAFQQMPCWPATESVTQYGNTIIIKIAEK